MQKSLYNFWFAYKLGYAYDVNSYVSVTNSLQDKSRMAGYFEILGFFNNLNWK